MSKRRSERIDRRTAEQILSGAADGRGHAVDELLAAATAPARERELRGEFAAVAAFGFELSQQENSPFLQKKHSPQLIVKGTTTLSPTCKFLTAGPTSTT